MIFGGRHLKKLSQSERTRSRGGPAKFPAIVCLLGLAVPAPAASGPGYLRSVGPAPLRFWSPPKRTPEPAATNAASASDESTAPNPNPYDFMNAFGAQPPLTMEATSVSGSAPTSPVTPAPDQAPANANANGSSTAPPGDVVSPQMFLKYFNKDNKNNKNDPQTSIYMPVDPGAVHQNQQPPPPPSSATYSN
jgi:hypothetical protein